MRAVYILYFAFSLCPPAASTAPQQSRATSAAPAADSTRASVAKPLAKVGSQASVASKAAPEPEEMSIKVDDSKLGRIRDEKALKVCFFCPYTLRLFTD